MNQKNRIEFETEEGVEVFFLEEETRIGGVAYLLVSDAEEGEANAYILKDISGDAEEEARYVMVEDPVEQEAVAGVFAKMLEDTEVTFETDGNRNT